MITRDMQGESQRSTWPSRRFHQVEIEALWVKPMAEPFGELVVGIVGGLEQVVVPGHTTTVFRWTGPLARHAGRAAGVSVGIGDVFDLDDVLPRVAEVVGVAGYRADLVHDPGQPDLAFVALGGVERGHRAGPRRAVPDPLISNSCRWSSSHSIAGTVCAADVLAGAQPVAGAGLGGQHPPQPGHREHEPTADPHGDHDSPRGGSPGVVSRPLMITAAVTRVRNAVRQLCQASALARTSGREVPHVMGVWLLSRCMTSCTSLRPCHWFKTGKARRSSLRAPSESICSMASSVSHATRHASAG
jgi:hypothetical protein